MGLFMKNRPQTFGAWFDDATRGFCDFAKGQVREEYEDHFTAAYEDLRTKGLGEEEAERAAVSSLGDARKVRRQLRKVYLTWQEEKRLEAIGRVRFPFSLTLGASAQQIFNMDRVRVLTFFFIHGLLIVAPPCRLGFAALGPWGALAGMIVGLGLLIAAKEGIFISLVSVWGRSGKVTRTKSIGDALTKYAKLCLGNAVLFGCLVAWQSMDLLSARLLGIFLRVLFLGVGIPASLHYLRWFFQYRSCARKIRSYSKQNTTLNVLALHYRLEEEQKLQESAS